MSDIGRILADYYARRLAWLVVAVGLCGAAIGAAFYHFLAP